MRAQPSQKTTSLRLRKKENKKLRAGCSTQEDKSKMNGKKKDNIKTATS